jgi:hypothetical protein
MCKDHQVHGQRQDFQHARANPNQRLKEVFGIDNGFTNPDRVFAKTFLRKTDACMNKAMRTSDGSQEDGDWTELRRQAMAYFYEYMDRAGPTSIKLAELTQYIVLNSLSATYSKTLTRL